MTLESSGQNFEKSASIKFQENPSTRSRTERQKNRQTWRS